jgi:uncharacterized membrane protein YsdA (DUF1294 family)
MRPSMVGLGIALLLLNVLAFIMMGIDKSKARKNHYRISEKTLLWLGSLSGGIGGLIAMKVFRHKTRHRYFYGCFGIGLMVWLIVIYYIY